MMRVPLPAAPVSVMISVLLCTLLPLAGCRQKPVAAPPSEAEVEAQQIKAAGAHQPAFYNAISDDALLGEHDERGVELALKMQAPSYGSGAAIPFRILIRDRAATEPIAAGLCQGLSLAWQKLEDNSMDVAAIDNRQCFHTIPNPDETALVRGAVKTVDISQRDASNMTLAPGRYLVNLSWQPYKAGPGTIMDRQPYATVKSNVILFTVTP